MQALAFSTTLSAQTFVVFVFFFEKRKSERKQAKELAIKDEENDHQLNAKYPPLRKYKMQNEQRNSNF
jgi:hypothetical protein